MSWQKQRDYGEAGVVAVWKWFSTMGLFAQIATGNWPQWDFALRAYVEIKRDAKAEETGRLFIETHSRGKESGLSVTKATTWVFIVGNHAIFLSVEVLRVIASRLPSITTPEGKTGKLLPLERLEQIPHVEANIGKFLE